jgi:hypothetical protein
MVVLPSDVYTEATHPIHLCCIHRPQLNCQKTMSKACFPYNSPTLKAIKTLLQACWPSPVPVRSRESGMATRTSSRAAVTATGRRTGRLECYSTLSDLSNAQFHLMEHNEPRPTFGKHCRMLMIHAAAWRHSNCQEAPVYRRRAILDQNPGREWGHTALRRGTNGHASVTEQLIESR